MSRVQPRSGASLAIVGGAVFLAAAGIGVWRAQEQTVTGAVGGMAGAAIIIVIGLVWAWRTNSSK